MGRRGGDKQGHLGVVQLGLRTAQLLAQPDGLGLSLAQGCGHALKFRLWKGDIKLASLVQHGGPN